MSEQIIYHLQSQQGNTIISAAAVKLIQSLRASEKRLGKQVQNVEIDVTDGEESFVLSLSRAGEVLVTEDKQASDGEQPGGSSTSPGAVPAATNIQPIGNERTLRATKRAK